jgi:hypothetical protein
LNGRALHLQGWPISLLYELLTSQLLMLESLSIKTLQRQSLQPRSTKDMFSS